MKRQDAIDKFLAGAEPLVYSRDTGKGVREIGGRNRGPYIDEANRLTGAPLGSPWCASSMAKIGHDALGSLWPAPLTAACDVLLFFARKRKVLHREGQRGDIFLVMNPSDPDDATHTGCAWKVVGNKAFTREGNTDDRGSREGWAFLERERTFRPTLLWFRWADLLDDVDDEDEGTPAWKVVVGKKELAGHVEANVVFADVTDYLGALFGAPAKKMIGWEPEEGGVTWGGNPLPMSIPRRVIDGNAVVGVRAMSEWMGLAVAPDAGKKIVKVYRPVPGKKVG